MPSEPFAAAPDAAAAVRPRTSCCSALGAVAAIAVLYLLVPRFAGLDDTWGRLRDGDPAWLGLAALSRSAPSSAMRRCSGSSRRRLARELEHHARGRRGDPAVRGRRRRRYRAHGVGAAALGHAPPGVPTRLSTFFVLLYGVFMAALVWAASVFAPAGFRARRLRVHRRARRVRRERDRRRALLALVPRDLDRRLGRRAAAVPAAMAAGVRGAIALVRAREPALLGALVWWGCDVLVLWASLHAFGADPPVGRGGHGLLRRPAREHAPAPGRRRRSRRRDGRRARRLR